MKKFYVIKFVLDLKERGVTDDRIKNAIVDWALEAHDKLIIIDEYGNHYIDGGKYLSHNDWEDEIDEIIDIFI